jgi:ribosomal protein S18 acetylase RimI-like enzyme
MIEEMTRLVARLAEPSDIPRLVDLMDEFYGESAFTLDRDWATRAFAYLIAHPVHGAAWLIEQNGDPIGHVVLSVRFAMEFGGLSAHIDDLFVRPGSRRQGAATIGLDALLAECRRRVCRSLHVEVGADNQAANALYRRYGLVPGTDDRLVLHRILEGTASDPC